MMFSNVLYQLKRRYGTRVTFHRDNETLDTELGTKIVIKQTWEIKYAILMPTTQQQKFVYDLSYIAGNRNFTMGAIFDASFRKLILDSKDLGSYIPQQRDYFTFEGKRWNLFEIHKFELGAGYMVIGQQIDGALPRETHNKNTRNRAIFSDSLEVL